MVGAIPPVGSKMNQLGLTYIKDISAKFSEKKLEMFDMKLDSWYFDGANEGEVGDLYHHMDENWISGIYFNNNDKYSHKDISAILKDGSEWGLFDGDGFPTRFLFEDFEEEVITGKAKYEEKQAMKKQKAAEKRLKKKEHDAQLLATVKQKLSKEELAAVRRAR